MTAAFVTKDSGERQTFASGMQRDSARKDLRPDLLPTSMLCRFLACESKERAMVFFLNWIEGREPDVDFGAMCLAAISTAEQIRNSVPMLVRWAELMGRGAEKYGERNWEKASTEEELERFKASGARHMVQWFYGMNPEEDHAAAVFFNISGAEYVKARLAAAPITEHKTRRWADWPAHVGSV